VVVLTHYAGPSPAEAATANLAVTGPSDVTLDGYPGTRISLTAPSSFAGCTGSPDGYQLFRLPLGAVISFDPGERMDLWVIKVRGKRIVVTLEAYRGQTAAELEQAQAIVESLRIGTQN
jgi:hypothetical protein